MKRIRTTIGWFTAFLCVTLLWGSPAMAENYELYIAGTQVTDANCNALKDIDGVTVAEDGEFKYDPATKTLTMKGVTVSVESKNAIWNNGIEGLKIEVLGSNRLEANDEGLLCLASTAIEGNGSLTAIGGTVGVFVDGTTLTIFDITLEATGKWGIAGRDGNHNETLIIKNATVTAKGTEAAIADLKKLTLRSCQIIAPAGAEWKNKVVVDAEGNPAKEVKIEPAAAKKYELFVAEVQVTDDNCDDLSGIDGVTVAEGGEFKYDPATKTLTMKDVTVSVGDGKNAIWNKSIEGLKIEVLGSNRLEATNQSPLNCFASTKIEGAGSFTTTSKESSGINIYKTTLTISDITLETTGRRGVAGFNGNYNETLIIKNATVTAKGTTAAICDLNTFTLEGCWIIAPAGAKWKDEKHAVVDAEGNPVKEVRIEPELYIAGTRVTSLNCNALKDIDGVTVAEDGEFKYDPATKTLTMKGVTVLVEGNKTAILNSGIEGLTIEVSGTNSLKTKGVGLSCRTSTEIKGNGSLTVASSNNAAVFVSSTTLTISNITLEATGKWGIAGDDGNHNETLIIKNATVTAKGTTAAICDLKTFTLEGCQIIAPAGAKWKDEKHAVVDAEGNPAKEVRIEPGLYIAGKLITSLNCNALKDIDGVTVAEGGEFKYDPATKTLTMKDVTVSVEGNKSAILNSGIEGLTIEVSGTNSLKGISGLHCLASTEIEGSGSLTIESNGSSAIYVNNTKLTISNITLEATGIWGIVGQLGVEILIIKNATITAKGTAETAITGFKTFTLEGCQIIAPAGAEWKNDAVVNAEGNPVKEVKIEPVVVYELYIAGTLVTSLNCNALKDIDGVTVAEGGEFKYDPATKTLTMKGVTVSVESRHAILNNGIVGLTIEVSGTNSLKGNSALSCLASTEIKGNGSLTTASNNAAIFVKGTTLTIFDITLEATGKWGIAGDDGNHNETLIIKNATVTAKGTDAAICDLKTFTLEGCQIIAPAGAEWKDEKHAVVNAEGNPVKEVKIGKEAVVAVTGVKVTPTTVDLTVNGTQQLTITVEPATATNKNYTCNSDNEGVATVNSTGLVTAVGVGTATITITTEDGDKKITCKVNVTESSTPTFTLTPATLAELPAAGGSPSVTVTSDKAWSLTIPAEAAWVTPSTTSGTGTETVTFTVATNETAAARSATVTFTQAETSATRTLEVKQAAAESTPPTFTLTPATLAELPAAGGSPSVTVTSDKAWSLTIPAEAAWVSASTTSGTGTEAVTFTVTRNETAAARSATVTFTQAETNVTFTLDVTQAAAVPIHVPLTGLSFVESAVTIKVGTEATLALNFEPANATNKNVTWAVTEGAASLEVDQDGKITATQVAGTAKVTVTSVENPTVTATCTVTVNAPPTAVEDALLAGVVVAPNPFSAQLRILNPEGVSVAYELVNLAGVVLRTGVVAGVETTVDTADLSAGLYFVRFVGENGAKRTVRVVKH